MCHEGDYFYSYTQNIVISKIDIDTKELSIIVGARFPSQTGESRDERLQVASFGFLTDMTWLIQDQVFLVCEEYSKFSVINLVDDQVTSICIGDHARGQAFKVGNVSSCGVYQSYTVNVIDGIIYITSTLGAGSSAKAQILKLTYSQPICGPPDIRGRNVTYSPLKERYTHNDTVIYTCDSGHVMNNSYNSVSCVRGLHNNGTVFGEWEKEPPTCLPIKLQSIKPTKGQRAGGTLITLNGVFSPRLRVEIIYSNNITDEIDLTRSGVEKVRTFLMPSNHLNSTDDNSTIRVSLAYNNPQDVPYLYLPNPVFNNVSRTNFIISGGFDMLLYGEHINSAYTYILHLKWKNSTFGMIPPVPCVREEDHVRCVTPNLTNQYLDYQQLTGKVEEEAFDLTCNLVGDNHSAEGSCYLNISNSQPLFDNNVVTGPDIESNATLILGGQNLNVGLLPSDYRVSLGFEDDSKPTVPCSVTRVLREELHCDILVDNIEIPNSASEVVYSVQVEVGRFSLLAGSVAFTQSQTTTTPEGISEATIAALVAAIAVAIIVLCIVAFLLQKSRQLQKKNAERVQPLPNEDNKEQQEMEEIRSWQQKLPTNLRLNLKDMYIEPADLSFSFKSEPIGKGHFGNVYHGQLSLEGNTLKTVAVKTLKDTEDIHLDQMKEFLEEATFIKYYNHVNILQTLGVVWRDGDRPNVVLPYMALGDLHSLLKKSDVVFPFGDLLHFGLQVATGMEFLVHNKCLHRDLAARNCLVDKRFLVKIADFGMSRDVYEDNYYRDETCDKPRPIRWMALESLMEGVYNSTTEVWSFGVLMWELFTSGSRPYPSINNSEIKMYLQKGYRLDKPAKTPPTIFELLAKCWLVAPESRPTFAELRSFLEVTLSSCRPPLEGRNEPSEIPEAEVDEFQYSYARQYTMQIPDDYPSDESFQSESNRIVYVDNPFIDEDYMEEVEEATNRGAYVVTADLETTTFLNESTPTRNSAISQESKE